MKASRGSLVEDGNRQQNMCTDSTPPVLLINNDKQALRRTSLPFPDSFDLHVPESVTLNDCEIWRTYFGTFYPSLIRVERNQGLGVTVRRTKVSMFSRRGDAINSGVPGPRRTVTK